MTPAGDRRLELCAVGLLLTVVEVSGFGVDFANDTVGYALVAGAAVRLRGDGPGWGILGLLAALAAVVALFTYGGVVSKAFAGSYVLWESMFHAAAVLGGAVVAGLAWALAARFPGTTGPQLLRTIGVLAAVLAMVPVSLRLLGIGVSGPGSHLLQLLLVGSGLVALVVVVIAFRSACSVGTVTRP